jgi:NAD-dependent dihydropyrimidine dehydrogenase PreA subunit
MDTPLIVKHIGLDHIQLTSDRLTPGQLASGDYYGRLPGQPEAERRKIVASTADRLALAPTPGWEPITPETETMLLVEIRLQRPWVDPQRCIGCGVCQHECPVKGRRAIRVTAENESRSREHVLLLS